jgi:DNA polymerase-3 subunit delta
MVRTRAVDCVLLITCMQWSKKQEGKWTQAIDRSGVFLALWPLKRDELPGWVSFARPRVRCS